MSTSEILAIPVEVPITLPSATIPTLEEKTVPDGFVLHTENTTSILFALPSTATKAGEKPLTSPTEINPVFLNPVQQYNRDLSIVAIKIWSEIRQEEKTIQWTEKSKKREAKNLGKKRKLESGGEVEKKLKGEDGESVTVTSGPPIVPEAEVDDTPVVDSTPSTSTLPTTVSPVFTFTLLEALSATGLRAIRYAKEIPLLRYVIANDLEPSAVESIRKNVEWNELGPKPIPKHLESMGETRLSQQQKQELNVTELGKVRPNEGDACSVMYNHRTTDTRFDCVDLDPYGSAVPFLDAAIGAVADGGLLCVTCTDLAVLAGSNYPEKCYSHYGGTSVNAEFSHEVALRLVIHSIAQTAARYGRYIVPQLSLSIDFYLRVFIRVYTGPKEVKLLAQNTALVYYCRDCQSPFVQQFGRQSAKTSEKTGITLYNYHAAAGPPEGLESKCTECQGRFTVGGPMWAGKLHSHEFIDKMLSHTVENRDSYGTSTRIEGMLTVARSEIESPFYFTPGRLSGFFHCTSPPLALVASALLNAGFQVSRTHASAGALKTSAPRAFVFDIMREWIKTNPVNMKNIKPNSPAIRLLAKEHPAIVDLSPHPKAEDAILSRVKVVRYQINPTANWGPGTAAVRSKAH